MTKSSFILIPGAGGMAWYCHRVVPLLEQAGYEAVAVDLLADDSSKGLSDYADVVTQAMGTRSTWSSSPNRWLDSPPPLSPSKTPFAG